MNTMTINQSTLRMLLSRWVMVTVMLVLIGAVGRSQPAWIVNAGMSLMFGLLPWREHLDNQRVVEIDVEKNLVAVRKPSLFNRMREYSYPLSAFAAVRSYIVRGIEDINYVELVGANGGDSLLLAMYQPTVARKSILTFPIKGEAQEALELRKHVADFLHIRDKGFLGLRIPAKLLPPT